MLKLLKLPLKLLALPLIALCMVAALLVRTAANLSSYEVGPIMLIILSCGVYALFHQQWTNIFLLAILEALCAAALFAAVVAETLLMGAGEALVGFLHS